MTGQGVYIAPGAWIEYLPPRAHQRSVERRRLILADAERFQQLADSEDVMRSFGVGDVVVRDAYRDMAAALRLLADERGT